MLSLLLLALVVAAVELPPPLAEAPEARRRATAANVSSRLTADVSAAV
jgi:hypothetical protein